MDVISVIGAGGKTTLIHRLAETYQRQGRRVLICTTTHMYHEAETDVSCEPEQIIGKIEKNGRCMAGKLCADNPDKIECLPEEVMEQVMQDADVVLIEADGAKHFSVKYPSENEPVIHPATTKVILVMGTWDIGHSVCDVVFRFEKMMKEMGIRKDDRLTFEMLNAIIQKGYLDKLYRSNPDLDVQILFTEKIHGELRYIGYEEAGKRYGIQ